MEDAQIIDHFFRRDPEALRAAQEKYEKRCLAAARHILPDARDAEECVSDVWLRLWNAIPPERPRSLAAYITTVTRRLALDKCDYNRAAQRRSDLTVAFEELEGCLPAEDGAVRALEQQEFRRVLNGFLRKLTRQSRTYFIRLQLAHIQDIIYQFQQQIGGLFNLYPAFRLFLHIVCIMVCHIEHTADSIDRSPDIMAHSPEKLCFCLIGCFCLFCWHFFFTSSIYYSYFVCS